MSNTILEKFEAIKRLVFNTQEPAPTTPVAPEPPQKMATDYPTKDGSTVLSISDLVVGGDVMVGDIAAPDAEYTLEDGTVITAVAGKITEIESPSAAATEPTDNGMEDLKKQVAQMSADFAAFKTSLESQKQNFNSHKEANTKVVELLEVMLSESKVAPVAPPKKFEEMTPLEKFRASKQN